MKPQYFKQANVCMTKPKNMTNDECGDLYVHRTEDGQCISVWKASFWQRIKFLFHGRIWLGVVSGSTQPPVWLDCKSSVFNPKDKSLWFNVSRLTSRRERRSKLKKV